MYLSDPRARNQPVFVQGWVLDHMVLGIKGYTVRRKSLLFSFLPSSRSRFFSLRTDPFLKGIHQPGKQIVSQGIVSLCKDDRRETWKYMYTLTPLLLFS